MTTHVLVLSKTQVELLKDAIALLEPQHDDPQTEEDLANMCAELEVELERALSAEDQPEAPINHALFADYQADFDAMTDEEIEAEVRDEEQKLAEAEEWLEAVAVWRAAGKPRNEDN